MTKQQKQMIEHNYKQTKIKAGYDLKNKLMWKDELFKEDEYYVLRQYYSGKVVMITEDVTELYE